MTNTLIVLRIIAFVIGINCAVLVVWYFFKHVVFQKCPPKRNKKRICVFHNKRVTIENSSRKN